MHAHGHTSSLGQASSGTSPTRSPLPGPLATVRLRLTSSETVEFDLPTDAAIDLPLSLASRPRSIATLSAFVSLK